jgi:hypothetical protein
MEIRDIHDPELEAIRRELEARPRQHGYYLLRLVAIDPAWSRDEEAALDAIFRRLDDKVWPPVAARPDVGPWSSLEVSEEQARQEAIAALVGGRPVGHGKDTVPPERAAAAWRRFRALFSADVRYFIRLGLGNEDYVFRGGAVIVDFDRAGSLCVVESD